MTFFLVNWIQSEENGDRWHLWQSKYVHSAGIEQKKQNDGKKTHHFGKQLPTEKLSSVRCKTTNIAI